MIRDDSLTLLERLTYQCWWWSVSTE